jgi:membrane-associated HD superfamily phosphohydrolase
VEAAARALAYQDSPSADSLKKIVDDVVNEKLEDGQFDDCDLTFGELNRVKEALLEALVSHYHHRITYPNFPGGPEAAEDVD